MKNKYYLILIILLFALSCKKGNPPIVSFTEAAYPLAVGNWWEYQINESNEGGGYDTITLSIVSIVNLGVYTNYKCYYLYHGTVTDSGYFQQSDTSLSFTNAFSYPNFGSFPNFHLKFPVETGQSWPGAFHGDSILVVGVANVCHGIYGTSFGPCYSIVESYNLPHNLMVNNMLLTAKVGLVHQSIDFNSDTAGLQINQSVDLINYHVQ